MGAGAAIVSATVFSALFSLALGFTDFDIHTCCRAVFHGTGLLGKGTIFHLESVVVTPDTLGLATGSFGGYGSAVCGKITQTILTTLAQATGAAYAPAPVAAAFVITAGGFTKGARAFFANIARGA